MCDKEDKMDAAKEAFAQLLSMWGNYFDDDDPIEFFDNTAPLVENFVNKFAAVEAAVRISAAQKQSSAGDAPEIIDLKTNDETSQRNNPPVLVENYVSNTKEDDGTISNEVFTSYTFPSANRFHGHTNSSGTLSSDTVAVESLPLTNYALPSVETCQAETTTKDAFMPDIKVSWFDEISSIEETPQVEINSSNAVLNGSVSENPLSVLDLQLQKTSEGEYNFSDASSVLDTSFAQYDMETSKIDDINGEDPLPDPTSLNEDTAAVSSRKRKFWCDVNVIEPVEEPDAKRPKFSDFLLGPLNPHASLFGTSAPRLSLNLGSSMNFNYQESPSSEGALSVEVTDDGNQLDDLTDFGETAQANALESIPYEEISGTNFFEDRVAESPEFAMVDEMKVDQVENNIDESCIGDETSVEASHMIEEVIVSAEATTDDPPVLEAELPTLFPSLFGRSVKPDPSPIKSPEKFKGVYETMFKDLLVQSHKVPDDEVMPMEARLLEATGSVVPLHEPESLINSVPVNSSDENCLVINDIVTALLIKVSEICQYKTDHAVSTLSDVITEPDDKTVDTTQDQELSEHSVSINQAIDAVIQSTVVDILDRVESTFVEPFDHEFDYSFQEEAAFVPDQSVELVSSEIPYMDDADINGLTKEPPNETDEDEATPVVQNDDEVDSLLVNIDFNNEGSDDETATFEHEMNNEEAVGPSVDNIQEVEESQLLVGNNGVNEEDPVEVNQNEDGDVPSAPKISTNNRSVWIPTVKDASSFQITGRKDGASNHFIPIFKQNDLQLAQHTGEVDAIIPCYARATGSNDQVAGSSGDSKAALQQALASIDVQNHRLSMHDVVARHSLKNDEIIVLDSDDEDAFNQTAKEFILDTDVSSKNPVPVKVHPSLTKILKKHQTDGISFLYKCLIGKISDVDKKNHTGAILAHCMGLGKTLQVITFLHTVLTHPQLRKSIRRVLILCPPGIILNWAAEFKKWLANGDKSLDTIKVYDVSTTQKHWADREAILKKWAKEEASVVIMGYEMFNLSFKNLEHHWLTSPGPDIIVCDEAHMLNSEGTQKFQTVRNIPTLRRISLTGTPIQNKLEEYYHMVDFVTPGLLGNLKKFKQDFINPISLACTKEAKQTDVDIMKKRASVLWKQLAMVMNRQNFSVLSNILPKKTEHVLFIRLSPLQQKMYERYRTLRKNNQMLAQQQVFADEHIVYRIGTFPYLIKLVEESGKKKNEKANMGDWYNDILKAYKCQVDSYDMGSKLVLFVALLKWFEKLGEKTIVFTHSLEALDIMVKMLESKAKTWFANGHEAKNGNSGWSWKRDYDYYVIQGSTAAAKRHSSIQSFNDPKNRRGRLFFCSDAGTVGTNMTGGTRIIVFDSKHNPCKEVQAIFRSYRIGQQNPVHVYRLVAQGTMEDCIFKRQIVKQQTAGRVLDNDGHSRTIAKNDINELLRFLPAPADVDFTKQPNYKPSGDVAFDEFCMANRNLLVEIADHDSLMAFNEEEKLAVDVTDNEWENYLRSNYSLHDDVFRQIQGESEELSLNHTEEIAIDDQKPCSSRPPKLSPSSQPVVQHHTSAMSSQSSGLRMPVSQPRFVRSFYASSPSSSHVIRHQSSATLRHVKPGTPRPAIRMSQVPSGHFGSVSAAHPSPGSITRPSHHVRGSYSARPPKRQHSPEVVCLDDENEVTNRPAKIPKSKPNEPSSQPGKK